MSEYTFLLKPRLPESVDRVRWVTWTLTREEVKRFRDLMVEVGEVGREMGCTGLFGVNAMPDEFDIPDFSDLSPEGLYRAEMMRPGRYDPPVEVGPDVIEAAPTQGTFRVSRRKLTGTLMSWTRIYHRAVRGPNVHGEAMIRGPKPLDLERLLWYEMSDEELAAEFSDAVDMIIRVDEDRHYMNELLPDPGYPARKLLHLLHAALERLEPPVGGGRCREVLPHLADEDLDRLWDWGEGGSPQPVGWTQPRADGAEEEDLPVDELSLRALTEAVSERREAG